MLKMLKYFLIGVFAAIIAAYFIFAARLDAEETESIACEKVEITIKNADECDFIRKDDIMKFVLDNYGECKGRLIDEIDCMAIENALKGITAIEDCNCYTDRSGTLNISVFQREPAIRFENGTTRLYSDREGYVFPVQGSHFPRVMVVTGDIPIDDNPENTDETEWLSGILRLNEWIGKNGYWSRMITQIEIDGDGDIVLIPQTGSFRIVFGDSGNIENKFYRLEKFYASVFPSSGEKYSEVSLKYKDQIVCKKIKH